MSWYSGLKARILFKEPLSKHTTFKIGPKADLWVEPRTRADLRDLIKRAKSNKIDYLVMGCGSKLLIRKKRIPLVIHLGSAEFKKIKVDGNCLRAGAGISSTRSRGRRSGRPGSTSTTGRATGSG